MNTTARTVLRSLAVAALAIGFAAAPATAQFGEAMGLGEMMSPYFLRRDLQLFAQELDLDEGQDAILESLYLDYEDAHEAGKVRMLQRLSNMKDEMKDLDKSSIMQLVFQPFEDRAEEWERLRAEFLINVQAVMNGQQLEAWPAFIMRLRREKEVPKGRLSGESVDLFHILREIDADEVFLTDLQPLLDGYTVRLDDALRRRENERRQSRMSMMHAIRDEDHESSLRMHDLQVDAQIAVRDTNDEFAETIALALPSELGSEFRRRARERGYPRIFRATPTERIFDAALKLEDITEETLRAIEQLYAGYLGELESINASLVRMLQEHEPEAARYRAASFAHRQSGQRITKPVDPTRPEFRRRDELGRRYIEQLRALLTPEQFASLPGAQRFLRREQAELNKSRGTHTQDGRAKKVLPNQGRRPSLRRDDE